METNKDNMVFTMSEDRLDLLDTQSKKIIPVIPIGPPPFGPPPKFTINNHNQKNNCVTFKNVRFIPDASELPYPPQQWLKKH